MTAAQVAKFAAVCVGPATIISATIGVTTLCAAGLAPWANFSRIWITWWLGDVAGALVVTPVIVLWARSNWRLIDAREACDLAAVLGCSVLVGLVAFSLLLPRSEYTSARLSGHPAAGLGGTEERAARYRDGWVDPHRLCDLGHDRAYRTIRADGTERIIFVVVDVMISVSVPSLALSADVAMRQRSENDLRRAQVELDRRVKERTAELADANIQLLDAQRLAKLGSWSWDITQN